MPNPDAIPVMGPRAMAVVSRVMDRLDELPVCPHVAAGKEDLIVWDSASPSRLMCARCYPAHEAVARSDRGCSNCGQPVGTNGAEISCKAADNLGMHFWMCEPCISADFPDGLPKSAGPARLADSSPASARLWISDEKVALLLEADDIPADVRVLLFLPVLWLSQKRGAPANLCVLSCLTLRHAYGQLGIRAELRAVELVVREPSGRQLRLSGLEPSWQGAHFAGHCVLWLPETGRLIDPTVQQFTDISLLREGPPVMGRLGLTGGLPTGLRLPILRDDVTLLYTVLGEEYTAMIVNGPEIIAHKEEVRREGINLASLALIGLRFPEFVDRARAAPFPRLHSLLDAIGDAPENFAEDKNWRFAVAGPDASPRLLDEIPLPAGTPLDPADEDPAKVTPTS